MSVAAMNAVWKHSQTTRGARLVMLALADWADDDGHVIYRKKQDRNLNAIMRKARLSERATIDAIDRAEEALELQVFRGRGAGNIHHYRLVLPDLMDATAMAAARAMIAATLNGDDGQQTQDMEGGPAEATQGLENKPEVSSGFPNGEKTWGKNGEKEKKPEVSAKKPEDTSAPYKEEYHNGTLKNKKNSEEGEHEDKSALFMAALRDAAGKDRFASWLADLDVGGLDPSGRRLCLLTGSATRAEYIRQRCAQAISKAAFEVYGVRAFDLLVAPAAEQRGAA